LTQWFFDEVTFAAAAAAAGAVVLWRGRWRPSVTTQCFDVHTESACDDESADEERQVRRWRPLETATSCCVRRRLLSTSSRQSLATCPLCRNNTRTSPRNHVIAISQRTPRPLFGCPRVSWDRRCRNTANSIGHVSLHPVRAIPLFKVVMKTRLETLSLSLSSIIHYSHKAAKITMKTTTKFNILKSFHLLENFTVLFLHHYYGLCGQTLRSLSLNFCWC